MNNKTIILQSKGFLLSVVLLLLNDFILKSVFHNWFTGKLSDFAGLFAFALFWTAFFPQRKPLVFAGTALGFIFWKTPLSQPLIDLWNSLHIFQVSRVVDYTDYLSLLILPLAWQYEKSIFPGFQWSPRWIAVLSAFAFMASHAAPSDRDRENSTYVHPPVYAFLMEVQQTETVKEIHTDQWRNTWEAQGSFEFRGDTVFYRPKEYVSSEEPEATSRLYTEAKIKKVLYDRLVKQGVSHISETNFDNWYVRQFHVIPSLNVTGELFGETSELNFKDSRLHGKQVFYQKTFEKTMPYLIAHYEQGLEQGEWTYMDRNGAVIRTEKYEAGELTEETVIDPIQNTKETTTYAGHRWQLAKHIFIMILLLLPGFGILFPLYSSFRDKTNPYLYNDGAMVLLRIALGILQIVLTTGLSYLIIAYASLQHATQSFFWKIMLIDMVVFLVYHSRKRYFSQWMLLAMWMVFFYLAVNHWFVLLWLTGE